MQLGEDPGEDALLGEDQLPGIDLDEIARPQGQHDAEIEDRLPFALGVTRRIIGDREADGGGKQRDGRGHDHRAQDDVEIRRPQQFGIGGQREFVIDQPGKLVDRKEALQQQRQQRADIDDAEPEQRRRQHQEQEKFRPAPEGIRQDAEKAAAAGQDGGCGRAGHAASSM